MADEPGGTPGRTGFWPDWLTPRRLWAFIASVIRLERSVARLEQENRELRAELTEVRKSVTEHDAQLRLLTAFVRDSLNNRLEARIEKLAAELLADRNKKS